MVEDDDTRDRRDDDMDIPSLQVFAAISVLVEPAHTSFCHLAQVRAARLCVDGSHLHTPSSAGLASMVVQREQDWDARARVTLVLFPHLCQLVVGRATQVCFLREDLACAGKSRRWEASEARSNHWNTSYLK